MLPFPSLYFLTSSPIKTSLVCTKRNTPQKDHNNRSLRKTPQKGPNERLVKKTLIKTPKRHLKRITTPPQKKTAAKNSVGKSVSFYDRKRKSWVLVVTLICTHKEASVYNIELQCRSARIWQGLFTIRSNLDYSLCPQDPVKFCHLTHNFVALISSAPSHMGWLLV